MAVLPVGLLDVKQTMRKELGSSVKEISDLNDRLQEVVISVTKDVIQFLHSEYVPYKIAERVVSGKMTRQQSLLLIHNSMYRVQALLTSLKLNSLPIITTIHSDVKMIFKTSRIFVLNNDKFASINISMKQREEELEYVMLDVIKSVSEVEKSYKKSKDFIDLISDQMDYINRLDSMIRLQQQIDQSLIFNTGVGNSSIEI